MAAPTVPRVHDETPDHGDGGAAHPPRNEVVLVGRVSAEPEQRELPSGDKLVALRLVVQRQEEPKRRPVGGAQGASRRPTVDTIDCSAWTPAARRSARALRSGDVVQVEGALRRRFWRAGPSAASRYEVEVARLTRLARPA